MKVKITVQLQVPNTMKCSQFCPFLSHAVGQRNVAIVIQNGIVCGTMVHPLLPKYTLPLYVDIFHG